MHPRSGTSDWGKRGRRLLAAISAGVWLSASNLSAQSNVVLQWVGQWTNTFSTYARAIEITNGIAYLGFDSLEIVDVRDPSRPVWLARYVPAEGGTIGQIAIVGGTAFLALNAGGTSHGGLHMVDVSQPAFPQRLGHFNGLTAAGGVQIVGSYALVADTYSGLNVLDISRPDAPVLLGQYFAFNPYTLQVVGDRAYLPGFWQLRVFDVSNLPSVQAVGSYTNWSVSLFRSVAVANNYAYLGKYGGVEVVDLMTSALTAQVSVDGDVSDQELIGQKLYLVVGKSGVLVCDLAHPTLPRIVGGQTTVGSAGGLKIYEDHVFVVSDRGLEVYRILNQPIGIAEQPRSQVFINNGQPLVLTARGVSVSSFVYQWSKDGDPLKHDDRISGATAPQLTISAVTPADAGVYRLTVSNEFGMTASLGATVTYRPGLHEALDCPDFEWIGGWEFETNITHDGVDAAHAGPIRSGIIAAGTAIGTRVTGPGKLSFWWRTTAEQDAWLADDFRLGLYVGSQVLASTSEEAFRNTGPDFWQPVSVDIPAGEQMLLWSLQTLGGCTDSAEGSVWLDQVSFTPTATCVTRIGCDPCDNRLKIECQSVPGTRLILQRSADLQNWEDLLGPNEAGSVSGRTSFTPPNSGVGSWFYRLRIVTP